MFAIDQREQPLPYQWFATKLEYQALRVDTYAKVASEVRPPGSGSSPKELLEPASPPTPSDIGAFPASDFHAWAEWALAQADRIDPVKNGAFRHVARDRQESRPRDLPERRWSS